MKIQPFFVLLIAAFISGCTHALPLESDYSRSAGPQYREHHDRDDDLSFYVPFVAATEAFHSEKYKEAAKYYLEALKKDPHSRYVADRAFFQLLYVGRLDQAASVSVTLCERDGLEDDLAHLLCVLEAFKKADWQAVHKRLEQKMATGFGYILTPLIEAWSYAGEGNIEGAKISLVPLLIDKRLKSIGEEHLAYILDYMGLYDEAVAQYEKVVRKQSVSSLQPHIAYAYMLYRHGDKSRARTFLGELAERFENYRFLVSEGSAILAGKKPTYDAHSPSGAVSMVFYRLATEFSQGGSDQTAVVYLRVASYLTPDVSDIYFMLGSLFEKLSKPDLAADAYKAISSDSHNKRIADYKRIEALKANGQIEKAKGLIKAILEKDPDDYDMLISMAEILQQKEDFSGSLSYYNRAIHLIETPSEHDWYVYFARGVSNERLGHWDEAEKDLIKALSLNDTQPSILNYLGYSWIDRGKNVDQAKKMIEEAVIARPDDGYIVDSLGWVQYLTGDYHAAVETLERAVRLEPSDATINQHLGDAYWRVGRKMEARFQWRHALDSEKEPKERATIEKKIDLGLSESSETVGKNS